MPKAQQARLLRKRCFVQMTGYEPVGADRQHHRFIREMARFQKAWNVQGKVSPPSLSDDGAVANWTVETWGPNWRVSTDFHWFRWDDFVTADTAESDWRRFPLGIAALMEFILTGDPVDAARAYELGLVNRVTETGGALDAALELAAKIAANGPLAVIASKKVVQHANGWSDDEAKEAQAAIARLPRLEHIPKSGYRFSERIMLHQRARAG